MALAVVGDAAVGYLVEELLTAVVKLMKKPMSFRPTLESLRSKLERISPLFEEIKDQNYALDRPKREIERLIQILEDGNKLICKCSKVRRWNYFKQMRYQKRLVAFDKSLAELFNFDMQALMLRDVRHISMILLASDRHGQAVVTVGVTGSQGKEVISSSMIFDFYSNLFCRFFSQQIFLLNSEYYC